MVSFFNFLFVEPKRAATEDPIIDLLTMRMTATLRLARPDRIYYLGFHQCVCGALSLGHNFVLPDGRLTNSLCVHYLAYHRAEVPWYQLRRVRALGHGLAEPTELELRGQGQGQEKLRMLAASHEADENQGF